MKIKFAKPLAGIICAAVLVAGSAGLTAYSLGSAKNTENTGKNDAPALVRPEETADATKNETVYVLANADGSVKKIIVSDWIKNNSGSTTITDKGSLSDVINVKGDETYTAGGDNVRVWNAEGNDIYCRGDSDKELPVKLSVSYKLDGKPISAEELAGKSGRITIRFDYRNDLYETVEIDGKKEKIYVPFAMMTGMLLDGDVFKNVEVENGKLVNDGDRTAVVGIAFPGLGSNLGIDAEKYSIPDYVEVTADATEFKMTNTVTVAVSDLFGKLNTDALYSSEITDQITKLTDAMGQLTSGASQLYDGLGTLLEKSGELISGIDKLAAGAEQLKNGAASLEGGAGTLAAGAAELADGLGKLSDNSGALNDGARRVFDSLLATANKQLADAGLEVPTLTIENYCDVLDGVVASLAEENVKALAESTAREKVTAAVEAKRGEISYAVTAAVEKEVTAKVTAAVRTEVETKVLAAMGMTREQYEAGVAAGVISKAQQEAIAAAVDERMKSDAVQSTIKAKTEATMQSPEIRATIEAKTDEQSKLLIEQNMQSDEVRAQMNAAVEKAAAGRKSIIALKAQLDSYNEFYTGLSDYTGGVDSAKDGADKLNGGAAALKKGAADLNSGIDELYRGILTLKNGAPALTEGVSALHDGAGKLSDGLKEFNETGVQKIVDAANGDLAGLLTRVKATADVAADYKSYTGLADGMNGSVKFIYRTDSISK